MVRVERRLNARTIRSINASGWALFNRPPLPRIAVLLTVICIHYFVGILKVFVLLCTTQKRTRRTCRGAVGVGKRSEKLGPATLLASRSPAYQKKHDNLDVIRLSVAVGLFFSRERTHTWRTVIVTATPPSTPALRCSLPPHRLPQATCRPKRSAQATPPPLLRSSANGQARSRTELKPQQSSASWM